jgi:hypothetical protein
MTSYTRLLNDAELDTVSGAGGLPLIATSTIVLPHIPQAKDLLTPDQIASLLLPPFNPPVPHG